MSINPNIDSGSVLRNIDIGACTKITGYYRGKTLVALKVVNEEMSVNIRQPINSVRDLRDLTSSLKPILSGNTQLEKVRLEAHEQTPFTPSKPFEKEVTQKVINLPQSQDPAPTQASEPPPPPLLEPIHDEQQAQDPHPALGSDGEDEVHAEAAAEQAGIELEEAPENVLEKMSLLSHSTMTDTEQQQAQQSSRSNKIGVQSETQKGTKATPDKADPAPPRGQPAHLVASASIKKHSNDAAARQEKIQDPSARIADQRMASTIKEKNALLQQSGLKNWDTVRAEFKQLLQHALKNSEAYLNGLSGKSAGSTLPFTTAQGTAAGNFKNTAFLNSSKQSAFSSRNFASVANKQKADAFAVGLKLLQMCMGKQLDELAATGKTIREEVIAGRIPLSASIPKDLKEILSGLLLGTPTLLTLKEALAMLALSKETLTAQGLPQALHYSPAQPLTCKPTQHSHAITAVAAIPGSTLFLSQSPMDQDNSAEEDEEEEEGERPLIRAVVFGSAEIALDAEQLIGELKETKIKVALLTTEASSKESYDLTAILKRAEWEKPSWKTQLFLAERLDVSAQETLFVAKDAKQAASARALGFEVIEYQSVSQLKDLILGQKEH